MQIRDIFATRINEKIEPVVKVADRKPEILYNELANLVVTPQWERHIHTVLDAYLDAADREHEQGIGVWISGFFGSGKSLLMKVLGMLLENGELQGQTVHQLFMSRINETSPYKIDIERFLRALTVRKLASTAVGGNLHSMLTNQGDHLPLVIFKLFAAHRGFTHNWPFAWAVEYQIDEQGRTEEFQNQAAEYAGAPWEEIANDPEYFLEDLYKAASSIVPDRFSTPRRQPERPHQPGAGAGRAGSRARRRSHLGHRYRPR
jgi:hypothetical protein